MGDEPLKKCPESCQCVQKVHKGCQHVPGILDGRLTTNIILISHSRLNEDFYDHTAMTLRNTQKAVGIMISDDCDLCIYPTKTYIMLGKEKNVR